MNMIKSTRAAKHLQSMVSSITASIKLHDAFEAVHIAEQDADERAVKAAKLWFTKLFPTITHPVTIDIMVDDFIELLNNGGQSDV